jgi:predicted porin
MKVKMLAVMMVLLILIPAGAAQAEDNYKIYGKLHMSMEMHNDGEDSQFALSNNGSRFGLKGASPMTECLKLIWQFEQKINLAQKGSDTLAKRNSYIGIKGKWGTALFGIHDTPLKTMGSKVTFFRDEIGDYRQTTFGWDRRLQDVVMYITPKHKGLDGRLLYQFDQGAFGGDEAQSIVGGSVNYKKEGLYLGVAAEMLSKGLASAAWTDTTDAANPVTNMVYGNSAMGIRAGAKYQMEKVGFACLFQTLTDYNQSSFAVNEFNADIASDNDKKAVTFGGEAEYLLNETYSAKVGFYMADPNTDNDDDEYNLLAVGVDKQFSKDMWLYLQYAMVMNGDASAAALGCKSNGHGAIVNASGPGESPTGISLGAAKKF